MSCFLKKSRIKKGVYLQIYEGYYDPEMLPRQQLAPLQEDKPAPATALSPPSILSQLCATYWNDDMRNRLSHCFLRCLLAAILPLNGT
ncbi:MAG: hypothetical protein PHO44_08035 [Sphaerochaetaceae bacterium]|nr:hypothetical protein [Sphaerochaetaceae bacterium]MDD4007915.1 hypothetical protein [Sphaerochaetaceae bacterium]MDD4396949.1 hypothetical protein [Sphaerochaetaceae bacterium]